MGKIVVRCLVSALVAFVLISGTAVAQEGKMFILAATPQTTHTGSFDSSIPPVLTLDSGDTVTLGTMMLMEGKLKCGMTFEELFAERQKYVDRKVGPQTLTGPIFVNQAEPGDVLEVRIKKLLPIHCGVNYHLPGSLNAGGLPQDFPKGQIKTFRFDLKKMETAFGPGITVPLHPFLGTMGVGPKPGEKRPAAVPDYFGGNMDLKELQEGSVLYLPVSVKGALFSTGDAHGVQGDGEVNVTAIETAMHEAMLQFVVRKDMKLERPMAETATHWITMGYDKDLNEAVRIALRDAIAFLVKNKGLTPDDAYSLSSIAVDLRVTQIVDGNKGIHAMIPKAIFQK
jgi:acetamidase/formamidase